MIIEFYKLLENTFTIDKVKKDLLSYLEIDNFNDFEIIISSSHEVNGTEKEFIFNSTDKITIESISISKKYLNQLYFPFKVNLVLGDYEESLGIIVYEKCCFEMFYDTELTLITLDITHLLEG